MDPNQSPSNDNEVDQDDMLAESQNFNDLKDSKLPSNGITIEVVNPRVKDDTFNKYVAYTVKGTDSNGYFEVVRRYSDFDKVRSLLVAKWPGCYIPPLPPKSLNSMDAKFVKERRRYLNIFCQKVAAIPMLHYYQGYQEFLRSKNPNLDKVFQVFSKPDYEEIIARYATNFSNLNEKEYSLTLVKKIVDFKNFLNKAKAQNENIKKVARGMVKAKNAFYQQFALLSRSVCMEYEKSVFSQYHEQGESKNVFFDAKSAELNQHGEKIDEGSKKASIEYLEEWFKIESREFEAFIEAIEQKENYDNLKNKAQEKQKSDAEELQKVLAGKTTMKAVFLRKNKEEEISQLEKQMEKSTKDLDDLTKLNDMITLVLGYEQIDKFKEGKLRPYFKCVRGSARGELETLSHMEEYWKTILGNKNIEAVDGSTVVSN